MREWFLTESGEPFIAFSTSHLAMLSLYVAGVFLLFYFHKRIRSNHQIFQRIRWTLFVLLIGSEILYQIWTATHGIWKYNLPFHLCGIASLIGAAALLTLNKKLIAITFFIGLIPAFLALLTPELPYDYPNFRYFKFFIHHIAISLSSIFLSITCKTDTITLKSMLHTYLLLVSYALLVGFLLNPWLNANYLYLTTPPVASTPLDWFGSGLWYRLNLGIVCLVVFFIQLVGFRWFERKFLR